MNSLLLYHNTLFLFDSADEEKYNCHYYDTITITVALTIPELQ